MMGIEEGLKLFDIAAPYYDFRKTNLMIIIFRSGVPNHHIRFLRLCGLVAVST